MRKRRQVSVAVVALLLLVPFLVPIPDDFERMRSLRALGVLAHFGLPAALAFVLFRTGPLKGRLLLAGLSALGLAAGCELLQTFVARHPRWLDVGVDLAGVSMAVGWLAWRLGRGRIWIAASVAGFAVLLSQTYSIPGFVLAEGRAAKAFPVLGDFESGLQMALWDHNQGGGGRYDRVTLRDGSHAMAMRANADNVYPGAIVRGLPRDWTEYSVLTFRARLEQGAGTQLTVRLDDFDSREDTLWCGETFRLDEEWRSYSIDLVNASAQVSERPFRLDDIDSLLLYLTRVEDGVTVLIDDIVLR